MYDPKACGRCQTGSTLCLGMVDGIARVMCLSCKFIQEVLVRDGEFVARLLPPELCEHGRHRKDPPPDLVDKLGVWSDRRIAEEALVCAPTVRRWRRDRGIPPTRVVRPPQLPGHARRHEIAKAVLVSQSIPDVAKRFRVKPQHVRRILRAEGLKWKARRWVTTGT